MDYNNIVTLEELNGSICLGAQEGELLKKTPRNTYVFTTHIPGSNSQLERINITPENAGRFLFMNANAIKLACPEIPVDECCKLAFTRLLCVSEGLVSPRFQPQNYHVTYTETQIITNEALPALIATYTAVTKEALVATLTPDLKKELTMYFTDKVCALAHVFRSRGHHYLDNYEDTYQNMWDSCRYSQTQLQGRWKNIVTVALHAIYPIILDDFYTRSVMESKCNGSLSKRYDSAPAGFAAIYVLDAGIRDVLMIAPGLQERLKDSYDYVQQLLIQQHEHRFNGSVNHMYYNAKRIVVNEKRLAAIGSVVKSCLEALCPDAPLNRSPALARIATQAPITGAVYAIAVKKIADRPEVVNSLLLKN